MTRTPSILRAATGVVSLAVVVIFTAFWVMAQYRTTVEALPEAIADTLSERNPLGALEDPLPEPKLFRQLRLLLAGGSASRPEVRRVVITKFVGPHHVERVLEPFDWDQRDLEEARRAGSGYIAEPLGADLESPVGTLYVQLDWSRLQWYRLGAWGVSGLAVLAAAGTLVAVRRQERELASSVVELRAKTAEICRLERLSRGGQLAASLLHDLKKPVLHIREEMAQVDDGGLRQTVLEQVDFFFQLVRDSNLEGFLRPDETKPEYVDIEEIVQRALSLVRYESRGVAVTVTAAPDVPLVLGYPHRLVQVFANLALNAYQAVEGQGHVSVTIAKESETSGLAVAVSIRDDGPGIPPDLLADLFKPFVSRRRQGEGTGLGLYICRTIVGDMGGRITVSSTPGAGATFTVTLPAGTATAPVPRA